MTEITCNVCVIGSGPGGYVAAIRAAQLGLKTVCVERERLGGVCLNWGCIPTKALLRSAEVLELCRRASEFGVRADNVSFDFAAMIARSRAITDKISKGVAYLFRKNAIEHVRGTARLGGAGRVVVDGSDGPRTIRAEHIIVATGARPRPLPSAPFDGQRIISYREAMTLEARPDSLLVIGAGAIGVEFASFYASLGTEVTVLEYETRLVPSEDADISAELARAFAKRGIRSLLGYGAEAIEHAGEGVQVRARARSGGGEETIRADKVLVAIGIAPNSTDLGLEELGIDLDSRGAIRVDDHYQTAAHGVYAIGDVVGRMALAHVASAEAIYTVERIAGHPAHPIDYETVPTCTYCHPEIASVGLTEEQAARRSIPVKVGKFPFAPLGRTIAAGEYPGFAKFLWHAQDGSLVGAHLIGPAVTDLIAEPTLAKSTEVNADSLLATIHAHPTFAEVLKEATEQALGRAIHL